MRVRGQKRAAIGRPLRRRRPCVRSAGQLEAVKRRQRIAGQIVRRGKARQIGIEQAGVGGQGRDATARCIGQNIDQPRGIGQRQRGAGALDLGRHMARQLQRHQLDHRDGIRGLPGRNRRVEQEHLGRATSQRALVDLGQTGVDAIGIGFERGKGPGVLHLDRALRQRVEIQTPDQRVDGQGPRAEYLGQAALNRAAHGHHLPKAVLRMGIAQPIEDIGIGRAEDMGHIGIVAHDLDRGGWLSGAFRDRDGAIIIGKRAGREPEDQRDARHRKDDQTPCNPQQPLDDPHHSETPLAPCNPPVS